MEYEVLDQFDQEASNLVDASKGQRFGHYVVDTIVTIPLILGADFLLEDQISGNMLISYLVSWSIMVSYYGITEAAFSGKTLGKLITRTRAIQENGLPLEPADAFKRALCRLIPFDALSFLGEKGWHDSITSTRVVEDMKY